MRAPLVASPFETLASQAPQGEEVDMCLPQVRRRQNCRVGKGAKRCAHHLF